MKNKFICGQYHTQFRNGARVFEDAYSGVFREQEDFFSCLHEIMGKSSWIRQKVRNLRLVPIIAGSTFEKELRSQYTEDML